MKRIFDLVFSSIGLFIFSPIILFACLGIYFQDKHSPFYIAKRTGKKGESFNMIKLRSMIINAEKSKVDSTSSNDPRITKIGKIIRKLKFIKKNDYVIITAGLPFGKAGMTNMVRLYKVGT